MRAPTNKQTNQRGMALLVSLVFLLLLTVIGISSMQNATLQEKMAASVTLRNKSFQLAEATLRIGESAVQLATYTLAVCGTTAQCAPPAESSSVTGAGLNSTSGSPGLPPAALVWGAEHRHDDGRRQHPKQLLGDAVPGHRSRHRRQ